MRTRGRVLFSAGGVTLVFLAYSSLAVPLVMPAARAPEPPPPPYPRFAGQTFEPSAASFDPASGRVLVLSDKDTTLYNYELSAAGLELPPGERHLPLLLPAGIQAAKLEGLARLPSGEFLAVTAFDRPDPSYRRLLRFAYMPGTSAVAAPVAVDEAALVATVVTASGLPWFKIEALAVDASGRKLLFGIRDVGQSYAAPRDVVLVVRCPFVDGRVLAPEAVIRFSTAAALQGAAEGLSDLQLDVDGRSFLMLTSHEATAYARGAHSGHLFRVPADALLGAAPSLPVSLDAPLRTLQAKPEGLAVTRSGRLVVVFHDDRQWKHLFAGYEQSDGLFTVIDPRG
jgi:hypothetical protein